MKREPDRLDFLIVVLPVLLVGLLGFQAYEYIQMSRQRLGVEPARSEEVPAATSGQESEPPEAASTDGESGDPQELPVASGGQEPESPEATPTDGESVDPEAQSADPAAGEQDIDEPAGDDPAPDAQEPAADAGLPVAEPSPPVAAATEPEAEILAADAAPVPAGPDAEAAAPEEAVAEVQAEVLLLPKNNPAKVGELITVDVVIREASAVSGAIFHLRYDTALLQLNEEPQSEVGSFLDDPDGLTRFNAKALPSGKVVVSINMAPGAEGRSGEGVLATFYFQVLAPGETRLDLLQPVLRDARNRPLPAAFSNATLLIVE